MTLLDARGQADALVHRRDALEREIVAMLPSSPRTVQVGRLRCLRDVDTLTAVGLCSEAGDFARFARGAADELHRAGSVGVTTGQQRRLGSITKTGSGHARRLLVEASWHYRSNPRIGKALTDRQDGQPSAAIAVAWSAQRRLDTARSARQTSHDHRGRRRPRTGRLRLGDHPNRVDHNPATTTTSPVGWIGGGPATRGEPAKAL